jgi:hypothetical protein
LGRFFRQGSDPEFAGRIVGLIDMRHGKPVHDRVNQSRIVTHEGQTMSSITLNLGQKLGGTRSIPEHIQAIICIGGLAGFGILWLLDAASVFVLIVGTMVVIAGLYALAHFIPALRSSLRIYELGLETMVQGKINAFRFDELNCLEAKFTDHKWKYNYIGTSAKIEFSVDGRILPCIYKCDFRRGTTSEKWVMLALHQCSQAIERRLLAELERHGAIRWRDNVSLTDEGIQLADSASTSRLIPYRQISDWKIDDNELKIWKDGAALPLLVFKNDSPNFLPLYNLFQSLAEAARHIQPAGSH